MNGDRNGLSYGAGNPGLLDVLDGDKETFKYHAPCLWETRPSRRRRSSRKASRCSGVSVVPHACVSGEELRCCLMLKVVSTPRYAVVMLRAVGGGGRWERVQSAARDANNGQPALQ